jgi:hypothetical protein
MTYEVTIHAPGLTELTSVDAANHREAVEAARGVARLYPMPAAFRVALPKWEASGLVIEAQGAEAPAWWACHAGRFEPFREAPADCGPRDIRRKKEAK